MTGFMRVKCTFMELRRSPLFCTPKILYIHSDNQTKLVNLFEKKKKIADHAHCRIKYRRVCMCIVHV